MMVHLQKLIAALREELQQYGELLALLEQRPDGSWNSANEDPLQSDEGMHRQRTTLQRARRHRLACQGALARQLAQPADVAIPLLVKHLPHAYHPLLRALFEENDRLRAQVQPYAEPRARTLTLSSWLFAPWPLHVYSLCS